MYKAISEIGGYKIGDVVPDEKAELWLKIYKFPPVEKSEGKQKDVKEVIEEVKEIKHRNNILEDYLGRNKNVVKKNILEDNLTNEQLEELLKLESLDKKRKSVIQVIKKELSK